MSVNNLPGMFMKSIIPKENQSLTFVLVAFLASISGQPWNFKGSRVTRLKCASSLKHTNFFRLWNWRRYITCNLEAPGFSRPSLGGPHDDFSCLPDQSCHRHTGTLLWKLSSASRELCHPQKCSSHVLACAAHGRYLSSSSYSIEMSFSWIN